MQGQPYCVLNRALLRQWNRAPFSSIWGLFLLSHDLCSHRFAGPHRHRPTHTMTQWSLCGRDQGPLRKGRRENPPKRDWCLCPYRCPSSSLPPSVYPSPAPSHSFCHLPSLCPSVAIPIPPLPLTYLSLLGCAEHACIEWDHAKLASSHNLLRVRCC